MLVRQVVTEYETISAKLPEGSSQSQFKRDNTLTVEHLKTEASSLRGGLNPGAHDARARVHSAQSGVSLNLVKLFTLREELDDSDRRAPATHASTERPAQSAAVCALHRVRGSIDMHIHTMDHLLQSLDCIDEVGPPRSVMPRTASGATKAGTGPAGELKIRKDRSKEVAFSSERSSEDGGEESEADLDGGE